MKEIKDSLVKIKDRIVNRYIYNRYARVAINKLIMDGNMDDSFLEGIRNQYIKATVPDLYKNINDPELIECIEYLQKHDPAMFCYEDSQKSHYDLDDVHYDEGSGLYYGYWMGKKVYFKRSYTNPESVRAYLSNSLWEQSDNSPHRYLTERFNVSDKGVVLDIGGAEGNFALTVLDHASKIYIFECDDEWIEALSKTFEDYKDRVTIVKKYVGDKDTDSTITIDTIMDKYDIGRVDMVKMDIEGAEISAIKGAKKAIEADRIAKWAVCTYHNPGDAGIVSRLLGEYHQEFSRGYIMSAVWRLRNLKYPYWVRGVLRADKQI